MNRNADILEGIIRRLNEENANLRSRNNELQAQINAANMQIENHERGLDVLRAAVGLVQRGIQTRQQRQPIEVEN